MHDDVPPLSNEHDDDVPRQLLHAAAAVDDDDQDIVGLDCNEDYDGGRPDDDGRDCSVVGDGIL